MIVWQPGITLYELELEIVKKAMRLYGNNRKTVASVLGVSPRTIDNRLSEIDAGTKTGHGTPRDDSSSGGYVESNAPNTQKQSVPLRERKEVEEVPPSYPIASSADTRSHEDYSDGARSQKKRKHA